jgi:N6-L-threonylcarbamoyladenine synthase
LNRDELGLEHLPLLAGVISGGHTNLYVLKTPPSDWPKDLLSHSLVGRSRDDAAGEAFDKTAKLLGFEYPGGAWIDRTAKQGGRPDAYDFPRALPQKDTLDFSFSGLKTAVSLEVKKLIGDSLEKAKPDLCASIQEAIVDALIRKMRLAFRQFNCRSLALVGGVAANSRLRERLEQEKIKLQLAVPPSFPHREFCTDNAAMIAAAGGFRFRQGHFLEGSDRLSMTAQASATD